MDEESESQLNEIKNEIDEPDYVVVESSNVPSGTQPDATSFENVSHSREASTPPEISRVSPRDQQESQSREPSGDEQTGDLAPVLEMQQKAPEVKPLISAADIKTEDVSEYYEGVTSNFQDQESAENMETENATQMSQDDEIENQETNKDRGKTQENKHDDSGDQMFSELADDESSPLTPGNVSNNSVLTDESPIERTYLGDSLDSLMMHWCQLLTNVSVRPPIPPPNTLDHVKEVAEVCSKRFRDACADTSNEFSRISVQWEMEEHNEKFELEEKDLDEAIERQEELIKKAKAFMDSRVKDFNRKFPDAGKKYTT